MTLEEVARQSWDLQTGGKGYVASCFHDFPFSFLERRWRRHGHFNRSCKVKEITCKV